MFNYYNNTRTQILNKNVIISSKKETFKKFSTKKIAAVFSISKTLNNYKFIKMAILPTNLIGLVITISVFLILLLNEQSVEANNIVDPGACHECCEYYCFDLDRKKYQSRHFGVKTAYPRLKDSELIKPFAGSRNFEKLINIH